MYRFGRMFRHRQGSGVGELVGFPDDERFESILGIERGRRARGQLVIPCAHAGRAFLIGAFLVRMEIRSTIVLVPQQGGFEFAVARVFVIA